ncbi:hypothetical protein RvY_03309 [Ramazzottius varieornatus]|uniref:Uncharacterized protein n=1 Tax=Ramazzottius varieornatus TaxID=947166 RepID=A0A1D1UMM9_RAMVA|nr:hypothetical protein RvY_03309 [Ramazzottius varieornatus]
MNAVHFWTIHMPKAAFNRELHGQGKHTIPPSLIHNVHYRSGNPQSSMSFRSSSSCISAQRSTDCCTRE